MKFIINIAFCLLFYVSNAQIPAYYKNINLTLKGDELKYELAKLITNTHTAELFYTPEVWNVLKKADLNPEDTSKVLLMYGYNDTDLNKNNDRSRNKDASCHTSDCMDKWVREHVFPRSKGTPNLEFEGPGSDAHHLRAVDYDRNSLRSNFKFIANPTSYITYSRVIQQNGGEYFYPGDEWKGDVARMIMYMYVRYGNRCQPVQVGHGSASYSNYGDMPNIFLQWNAEDPVSAFEIQRNEQIYQAQGNRNPFIDNPYLATLIWNGPFAQNKWNTLKNEETIFNEVKVYPTYTNDLLFINANTHETKFEIYDSSAKLIHTDINKHTVNVAHFTKGLYFLKLFINSNVKTYKFVKN